MTDMHDEQQPLPSSAAREVTRNLGPDDGDPRMRCWFDGAPAVALAPRNSGGDLDIPAHWLPVCQHHADHWHDETEASERLPLIPRNGVGLTVEHAAVLYAAICDDHGDFRDFVNQDLDALEEAVDSLHASIRASRELESSTTGFPWDTTENRHHLHRLFDSLNPHRADAVATHLNSDAWAQQLDPDQLRAVDAAVRSLDPDNLRLES